MPIFTRMIFLLVLVILCASNTQAQMCGRNFSHFIISNSEAKSISTPTIEILAMFPKENVQELWQKYGDHQDPGGYGYFKIRERYFREVMKRSTPLKSNKDDCGNPLKQIANSTKVTALTDDTNGYANSITNFGYCTFETHLTNYLLKISAPGYKTSYYIGTFLGGCYRRVYFVLSKNKRH